MKKLYLLVFGFVLLTSQLSARVYLKNGTNFNLNRDNCEILYLKDGMPYSIFLSIKQNEQVEDGISLDLKAKSNLPLIPGNKVLLPIDSKCIRLCHKDGSYFDISIEEQSSLDLIYIITPNGYRVCSLDEEDLIPMTTTTTVPQEPASVFDQDDQEVQDILRTSVSTVLSKFPEPGTGYRAPSILESE